MPLCFIEPQEAIRVVAESVGREARRQLLGEVVRAWVDEIPDDELQVHYAKAVDELDDDDLSILAAWHASLEVGQPIANKDFLLGAFARLGEHRREALRIAAGFKGDDAFEAGVSEEQALDTVLPWLVGRAPDGARRGGGGALLLGPPRLRQLAGCKLRIAASSGSRASHASHPASLRCSLFARLLVAARSAPGLLSLAGAPITCQRGRRPARRSARPRHQHTDGDTLWLSGIGKVRLIGVDTPEVYRGRSSASAVRRRRSSSGVLPLGTPRDATGSASSRATATAGRSPTCTLRRGRFLNRLLVARGYAQPLYDARPTSSTRTASPAQRGARGGPGAGSGPPGCR